MHTDATTKPASRERDDHRALRGCIGGRSRKLGNVVVNIRRLVGDFGDIGLAAAAGASSAHLIPFAAMLIWSKIWANSSVQLTREQASLVYAMWISREMECVVSRREAFEMCRLVYTNNSLPAPTQELFECTLSDLVSLGCIELQESGNIRLCEGVCNTYP